MAESKKICGILSGTKKSYSGIPEAEFMKDVETYMKLPGNDNQVDKVLKKLDETHSKYKFMEYNLVNQKRRWQSQIPDWTRSLELIKKLQSEKDNNKEIDVQFLLSENLYAKAIIPPTDTVCLWLGANVMLEYTLEDAHNMMSKNLDTAKMKIEQLDCDLAFVRDQFTTTEVNMARVYNWDVKKRQLEKSAK